MEQPKNMRTRFLSRVLAMLLLAGAVLVLARGQRLVAVMTPLALVASCLVLPKPDRPWFVAALLGGAMGFAPKTSFVMWLVPTTFLVVLAALVLTCRESASARSGRKRTTP